MSVFNIFGKSVSKEKKSSLPWISLNKSEQLNELEKKSEQKSQIIFKHSNRCGISRAVLNAFESDYAIEDKLVDLYFVNVLEHREVSNKIAATFQVVHQSPQLLIIKKGKVVHHASHGDIAAGSLANFIT